MHSCWRTTTRARCRRISSWRSWKSPSEGASPSWWTPSTANSSSTPAPPSLSLTAGSWSPPSAPRSDLQNGNALPEVLTRLRVDNLLVTLGADGMVLVTKDGSLTQIPQHRAADLRCLRRGRYGYGLARHRVGGRGIGPRGRTAGELRGRGRGGEGRASRRCRPRRCWRFMRSGSIRSGNCGGAG